MFFLRKGKVGRGTQWEGWVGEFCQFNYIISSVLIEKKR